MVRIHVIHNYGGAATSEQRIRPGVYEEDAPELFGLALYLVVNGHATVVDGTVEDLKGYVAPYVGNAPIYDPEVVDGQLVNVPDAVEVTALEGMTVKELKARADSMGLTYRKNATQGELSALIAGAEVSSGFEAFTLDELKHIADENRVAYTDHVTHDELVSQLQAVGAL